MTKKQLSNSAAYETPTVQTYMALDRAFHFFNERLFYSRLPAPHFTVHRKRGAHGYFWAEQFKNRDTGEQLDEIALNPDTMGRTLPEVLSTLVHEMVHLRQQHEGKPSNGSHNKEWANMMDEIGLIPTSTGEEGGKRTGRKVAHMIDPDGHFAIMCEQLLKTGFVLPWFTDPSLRGERKAKKKDLSKLCHECPSCAAKAWAKQGSKLICGECGTEMLAEEVEE
jgi:predicted SprT family Zn-dependent metalloprotease